VKLSGPEFAVRYVRRALSLTLPEDMLRDTSSYERCEVAEIRTSQRLTKFKSDTKPLVALGALY